MNLVNNNDKRWALNTRYIVERFKRKTRDNSCLINLWSLLYSHLGGQWWCDELIGEFNASKTFIPLCPLVVVKKAPVSTAECLHFINSRQTVAKTISGPHSFCVIDYFVRGGGSWFHNVLWRSGQSNYDHLMFMPLLSFQSKVELKSGAQRSQDSKTANGEEHGKDLSKRNYLRTHRPYCYVSKNQLDYEYLPNDHKIIK